MKVLHMMISGKTGGIERLCVDISRLSSDKNYFYFFWGGGICADAISEKCSVIIRNFKYRNVLNEYYRFRKYIKENKFDAIVLQYPAPILMLFLLMLPESENIFLYLHADPKSLFDSKLAKYLLSKLKKRIRGTICISKFVLNEYWYQENAKIIYNGTDIDCFKPETKKIRNSDINLIYVGRIVEDKGLHNLLHILQKIKFPYSFTIVGNGNYLQSLETECKRLNLQNKVQFVGEQKNIVGWLQTADLFIHPALCKEGFGITLIESMACGVPCIAYNRGAIPEIISDGIDGFLVEKFESECFREKLEDAMELFYSEKNQYAKICEQARMKATNFDVCAYVKNLSKYIEGQCR